MQEKGTTGARDLVTLIGHFGKRAALLPASEYRAHGVQRYPTAFYLAGYDTDATRRRFVADLAHYTGTVVWIGPGVESLGEARLFALGLTTPDADESPPEAGPQPLVYRGQSHVEELSLPLLHASGRAPVLAKVGGNPFICGKKTLWYGAAAPRLEVAHFWSSCVWADALHEIMGEPHRQARTMIAALRDVPVWANEGQAPKAVGPMLRAGVPVTLLATVMHREVALADRPHAVEGLRRSEAMGATVALHSPAPLDPREQLRVAWEVGLHPLAWQGGQRGANPFHLRIADLEGSPPYQAGGLLPCPIALSDAGYIAGKDLERLEMQGVVRDSVAVLSFSMWATPSRFVQFLRSREANRWRIADLRELGAEIGDSRRIVTSHRIAIPVSRGDRFQVTTFDRNWVAAKTETIAAAAELVLDPPARGAMMLERARQTQGRDLITAVTLDPWAYSRAGTSSKALATVLAERYQDHGVNAVFVYCYNVEAGAAYRTRYRGSTMSEWGEDDLLGHLLDACHARGIRVIAWLYSGRDRGMWTRHRDWRERTAGGEEYNPLRLHAAYFLCPRHPEVRRWYAGLLTDLVTRYPTLDGVELCEPLVNWYGNTACYCETCRREFARAHPGEPPGGQVWRRFRADGLTEFLSGCINEVARRGIETYVMTICDALDNGATLTSRRQWEESGFDLEALLDGPSPPDWVNFEIIWQQWAVISRYGTDVFDPDWAAETAQRLSRRVDGRAKVMIHLELTDFGLQLMTPERLAETIRKVMSADPAGVECYHSNAFDRKSAWPHLSHIYEEIRR